MLPFGEHNFGSDSMILSVEAINLLPWGVIGDGRRPDAAAATAAKAAAPFGDGFSAGNWRTKRHKQTWNQFLYELKRSIMVFYSKIIYIIFNG